MVGLGSRRLSALFQEFINAARCTGAVSTRLPGCSSCPYRVGPESASTTTAFFAPLGIVV
jgi:hypothetical protein